MLSQSTVIAMIGMALVILASFVLGVTAIFGSTTADVYRKPVDVLWLSVAAQFVLTIVTWCEGRCSCIEDAPAGIELHESSHSVPLVTAAAAPGDIAASACEYSQIPVSDDASAEIPAGGNRSMPEWVV